VFLNYEPPTKNCKRTLVSPINPRTDHAENTSRGLSLSLSLHCCVTSHPTVEVLLPSVASKRAWCGSARHGTARHGTEKTPFRLLLRNRGNVFRGYTVLAWRKYATVQSGYPVSRARFEPANSRIPVYITIRCS
jgi:hypothetical protein